MPPHEPPMIAPSAKTALIVRIAFNLSRLIIVGSAGFSLRFSRPTQGERSSSLSNDETEFI